MPKLSFQEQIGKVISDVYPANCCPGMQSVFQISHTGQETTNNMNNKRNYLGRIFIIITLILCFSNLLCVVFYGNAIFTKILIGATFWVYGIMSIGAIVSSLIDFIKNWKQRWTDLTTTAKCYRIINTATERRVVYSKSVAIAVLLLFATLLPLLISPPPKHNGSFLIFIMFPMIIGYILAMTTSIPMELINTLTAHICFTVDGIYIKSVVKQINRPRISWEQLTSIYVYRNAQCSSDIIRVMVQGQTPRSKTRTIIIPGSHPDIDRITQDLCEFAPDKVQMIFIRW